MRGTARKLTVVVPVLAFCNQVAAAEHRNECYLRSPSLIHTEGAMTIRVTLACEETSSDLAIPYPEGPLYIGIDLYNIRDLRLQRSTLLVGDLDVDYDILAPIAPVTLNKLNKTQDIDIKLGDAKGATHFMLAVWDKRRACRRDDHYDCKIVKYVYGDVDGFGFPVPVDVLPRPVCDVQTLERKGFFKWVATEGDPAGVAMPDEYGASFADNDCFTRLKHRLGLGYSVRRWRVEPLPED